MAKRLSAKAKFKQKQMAAALLGAEIPKPYYPINRRQPKVLMKDIRRYAKDTGVAIWTWNQMHSHLFVLFWFIIGDRKKDSNLAKGIWDCIQSDSLQRAVLKAAIENGVDDIKLKAKMLWTVSQINILGSYRNMAAHIPVKFKSSTPEADELGTRNTHYPKFVHINHKKFWGALAGDLNALYDYTTCLIFEFYAPGERGPLPQKPKLLSPAMMKPIEAQISSLGQQAVPKRPKKPSRKKGRPKGGA